MLIKNVSRNKIMIRNFFVTYFLRNYDNIKYININIMIILSTKVKYSNINIMIILSTFK